VDYFSRNKGEENMWGFIAVHPWAMFTLGFATCLILLFVIYVLFSKALKEEVEDQKREILHD
jgi:hypothetical protein